MAAINRPVKFLKSHLWNYWVMNEIRLLSYSRWLDFANAIFLGFVSNFGNVTKWILKLLNSRVVSRCGRRRTKLEFVGRHFRRVMTNAMK